MVQNFHDNHSWIDDEFAYVWVYKYMKYMQTIIINFHLKNKNNNKTFPFNSMGHKPQATILPLVSTVAVPIQLSEIRQQPTIAYCSRLKTISRCIYREA